MGESKSRKQAILTSFPRCYYCGKSGSQTVDHVPARAFFRGKVGPEGFEYGACFACNSMTRYVEQAVSFYITLLDHGYADGDHAEREGKMIGLWNNFPELLPLANVSANEKRRAFEHHDPAFRISETFAEEPILRLPDAMTWAFETFAFKLTASLYQRHFGSPLEDASLVRSDWFNFTTKKRRDIIESANKNLPGLDVGRRVNTSIGDQFIYRYGANVPAKLFAFVAQLRKSALVVGVVGPQRGGDGYSDLKTAGEIRVETISRLNTNPKGWIHSSIT